MLTKTHFSACITLVLLLDVFDMIQGNKLAFAMVALIATLVPDSDSRFSRLGRLKVFRFMQFFIKHRGILHSFTFLFAIGVILYFFVPSVLYPFIYGYGLHLVLDMMTVAGIAPLYPVKKKIKGFIRTGGKFESFVYFLILFANFYLILRLIYTPLSDRIEEYVTATVSNVSGNANVTGYVSDIVSRGILALSG